MFLDITVGNIQEMGDLMRSVGEWLVSDHANLDELRADLDSLQVKATLYLSEFAGFKEKPPRPAQGEAFAPHLQRMDEQMGEVRKECRFFKVFMEKACGVTAAKKQRTG